MSRPPAGKIRILHVVQVMGFGGMEGRIRRLAEGLDAERFEILILTLREGKGPGFNLPPHVSLLHYPLPPGWHLHRLPGLASLIRKSGAHIVHTHNWGTMFHGILAGRMALRPRLVHGEHGLNVGDLGARNAKRVALQRILARLAHLIVPVNSVIAHQVSKDWKLAPERLRVIVNGVDLERFRPGSAPPPGVFTVGTIARLDAVKDLPCLLQAIRILKAGGETVRAVIVGDGPDRESLRRIAGELGIADEVEFTGAASDVHLRYGGFSVMVNCSVYEGMSNTLLEAMACGLPLVASGVEGNAVWLKDGENALFFPARNPEAMASRLREFIRDPERGAAMGRRNRARVEAEFDNRKFLAEYVRAYEGLLGIPEPGRSL